ncbi:hypothetical protein EVG20_g958 [Dentipellis fragilis]|uniref:Clathrin/coatomer adaptor adaptin-like N-terminal domain-containing protein n=1 Tax=Dentipellis fragilis TaxID=205917 RepID=A0A4Y9ZE02_9AGAM|nr:hypothetical protein EVG20_g958 [Dentipellis fragilis]
MSEAADLSSKYVLQTAGFDARFPNSNQTRHCFQSYCDYFKCVAAKGEDFAPCKQFKRAYNSLCPNEWVRTSTPNFLSYPGSSEPLTLIIMSGLNLNSLTENASRLGMRIQESFSEHTRDLAFTRGGGAAFFDTTEDKVKNIRKQLDSNSDREKLEAMKRLIAMISKGRNVSEFFAQVVKNVAVPNLEVRKLVYIYLLRYADAEPDLALLSINTFQRDLADSSPLIRAMALRVLSGIRVPSIGSIVVLAIKKCASDVSPYVRKAAALAIPKCYSLDTSHLPSLIQIISNLLRDRSPLSIGSVAVAFDSVCPTRLDLIHTHYRRLCKMLVDVDEWGQVDLLELLTRYARTMLPKPSTSGEEGSDEDIDGDLQLLLKSAEPLFQSRNPAVVLAVSRTFYYLALPSEHAKLVHPLLRLLDTSTEVERVTLTYILTIARTSPDLFAAQYARFLVCADDSSFVKAEKMRLLQLFVNGDNWQALLREFIDYVDDVDDSLVAGAIHAIGHTAGVISEATQQCLNALLAFIKSRHDIVVTNAVLVLKSLVQTQLQQPQAALTASASSSTSTAGPLAIIERIAYRIDEIRHPQARACVIWLVGQYAADENEKGESGAAEGVVRWAPDTLRRAAKSFRDETSIVKLQIVTLAAKLLVLSPSHRTLGQLTRYVFQLARYDRNYDVRDRARMLGALLGGVAPGLRTGAGHDEDLLEDAEPEEGGVVLRREQVRVVLFQGKAGVVEKEERAEYERELLGTLTLVTGHEMHGDRILPDWLEQGIEPALRDSEEDAAPPTHVPAPTAIGYTARGVGAAAAQTPVVLTPAGSSGVVSPTGSVPNMAKKGAFINLDSFYASEDGEEEESEEESEEEEEGGEGGDADEKGAAGHEREGEEEEEEEGSGEEDDEQEEESGDEQEQEPLRPLHS